MPAPQLDWADAAHRVLDGVVSAALPALPGRVGARGDAAPGIRGDVARPGDGLATEPDGAASRGAVRGGPAEEGEVTAFRPGPVPPAPRPGYLVAVYHTHTSEMYRRPDFHPQDARDYHRFGTTDTGIVRVGRALADALNELGIPTLHVATVHDYPNHAAAYDRSLQTVRALVARYPTLLLLLDVHRDAPQEGGALVTSLEGEDVARTAIVVGTGRGGAEGKPNLSLARRLNELAELRFPGLMRRIIEVPGRRYNQQVHPGALLVEVGSYRTSETAALRAARLLAMVVADLIWQWQGAPGSPRPRTPLGWPGRI